MPDVRRAIATLVLLNAFVGGMVGLERATLPLLARDVFGMTSGAAILSFIVTFGIAKALVNLVAGKAADRVGRRNVLILGWLLGAPVPLLLMLAPSWGWILFANVLLGANQGLCWSMTLNMKLDLAGPRRRGLVAGLNEAAGYLGLGAIALASGLVAARYGLRPEPYYLGLALVAAGLLLSLSVRETHAPAAAPAPLAPRAPPHRAHALASLAGLATNLKDGALWGLLPLLLVARGADLAHVGVVTATYPVVWGLGQIGTGPLSDRVGRKPLILGGLLAQAVGVASFALATPGVATVAAAATAGAGTAMAYPTLLAFVADHAPAARRATALGIYRFWRDLGYAFGALAAGIGADAMGAPGALMLVAALLLAAGALVGLQAKEAPRAGRG